MPLSLDFLGGFLGTALSWGSRAGSHLPPSDPGKVVPLESPSPSRAARGILGQGVGGMLCEQTTGPSEVQGVSVRAASARAAVLGSPRESGSLPASSSPHLTHPQPVQLLGRQQGGGQHPTSVRGGASLCPVLWVSGAFLRCRLLGVSAPAPAPASPQSRSRAAGLLLRSHH